MLPFNVWAQSLWETLYMVILSTAISYLIGLPLGLTLVAAAQDGQPRPVVPLGKVQFPPGLIAGLLLRDPALTAGCLSDADAHWLSPSFFALCAPK